MRLIILWLAVLAFTSGCFIPEEDDSAIVDSGDSNSVDGGDDDGDGGDDDSDVVDDTTVQSSIKYLASNIILRSSTSAEAQMLMYPADTDIDSTTKIYAENVIFESESNSSVESDNVQDAINELSLILSKVMIGTWDIENKNNENLHSDTGKIQINADGTFYLMEGSFAAIGQGSGEADPFCDHIDGTEMYTVITDEVIIFEHYNGSTLNSVIPTLISVKADEIIYLGSGGCGQVGKQRVSILTRATATD